MIKAVIFDYGGVLDSSRQTDEGFKAAAALFGVSPQKLYNVLFNSSPAFKALIGAINEDTYYDYVAEILNVESYRDELPVIIFGQSQINPQLLNILKTVRKHNYRTAIISNALPGLEQILNLWEVTPLFDLIVNSAVVKLAKPDPRIYELALKQLALKAKECLFIDDQPINVDTAQNLGMNALHYLDAVHLTRWLQQYGIVVSQDPEAEKQAGAGFRGDNLSPWTDNNILSA
ncbi:MAG: HAD family hydrolase [Promethearchaeota archaeon]